MNFIVNPLELISPLDTCSCGNNSGTVTYSSPCNNNCTRDCGGYCGTFEVCVTPTGVKYSPEGINPKA
ncbi:hypothetical protein DW1_2396 [Proteiniborus sp. DW1]|uniref:hypothetical protein n=1 Tax=Proteiniborus sp. DW1 TaxID=1889883 RepID=UPI00092DF4DB|nr:hypothetical protein [Proteiniborus sp. DW1]SCG83960.1 hypothetical protein DW1_2396 [Proteiniborus sp. DW1]